MVDIVAIPQRLENSVAEAQNEQILYGVFAQVVIDAVDLILFEDVVDNLVQLLCRNQVAAERLFNNDPHPCFRIARPRKARAAELLDDVDVNFGWSGKIKDSIAAKIVRSIEFNEAPGELGVGFLVAVVSWTIKKIRREFVPFARVDRPAFRNGLGSFTGRVAERLVRHRGAREAYDRVAFAERIMRREIEECRNDLAFREVSGSAEKNDGARFGRTAVRNIGRKGFGRGKNGFCSHELSSKQPIRRSKHRKNYTSTCKLRRSARSCSGV